MTGKQIELIFALAMFFCILPLLIVVMMVAMVGLTPFWMLHFVMSEVLPDFRKQLLEAKPCLS